MADKCEDGVAAMLDDITFCFFIQHSSCHTVVVFGSPGIGCKPPTHYGDTSSFSTKRKNFVETIWENSLETMWKTVLKPAI